MTTTNFAEIGRNAHRNGEPRAPFFNSEVAEAIANLPVGGGATQIMAAFTRGWDAENMAAVVA